MYVNQRGFFFLSTPRRNEIEKCDEALTVSCELFASVREEHIFFDMKKTNILQTLELNDPQRGFQLISFPNAKCLFTCIIPGRGL